MYKLNKTGKLFLKKHYHKEIRELEWWGRHHSFQDGMINHFLEEVHVDKTEFAFLSDNDREGLDHFLKGDFGKIDAIINYLDQYGHYAWLLSGQPLETRIPASDWIKHKPLVEQETTLQDRIELMKKLFKQHGS